MESFSPTQSLRLPSSHYWGTARNVKKVVEMRDSRVDSGPCLDSPAGNALDSSTLLPLEKDSIVKTRLCLLSGKSQPRPTTCLRTGTLQPSEGKVKQPYSKLGPLARRGGAHL